MRVSRLIILLPVMLALLATSIEATERGVGRYITGNFAMPRGGLVPITPDWYFSNLATYYNGSGTFPQPSPVGAVEADIDVTIGVERLTLLHVYESNGKDQSRLSGLSLPVEYVKLAATADAIGFSEEDSDLDLGDLTLIPVTLGYLKRSKAGRVNAWSAGLRVYAPTGKFDAEDLANPGLGYWTFQPVVAYTHIDPARGMEFTASAGLQVNTKNPETDYLSGSLVHIDLLASKTEDSGWGYGLVTSWMTQITDDTGGGAEQLDGLRGRVFALGPLIRYKPPSDEKETDIHLIWDSELDVKNRPKGNAIHGRLTMRF